VVGCAPPVKIAIFDHAPKRIDRPLLALDTDYIYVPHQQEWSLAAVSFYARDDVAASGFHLEYLGGYAFAGENRLEVFSAFCLVAGRVAGVYANESRKNPGHFVSSRGEVWRWRLLKRTGERAGRQQRE